jgi:predicted DNA-binding protein (MmcQ/YjbR family)
MPARRARRVANVKVGTIATKKSPVPRPAPSPRASGAATTKPIRELTASALAALARVRKALAAMSNIEESASFGNPTFRINGKAFAVIDRYEERDCLWLRVAAPDREHLLERDGWFPSPYDPRQKALCCSLDRFDWRRLKPLLRASRDLALPQPRLQFRLRPRQ